MALTATPKSKPETSIVSRQVDLARALGLNKSTVSQLVARRDWPFGVTGPWDVERVRDWHERALARPINPATEAAAELKREQLKILRAKLAKAEGDVVPKSWHLALLGRWSAEMRSHLDEMCDSLPAGWPYASESALREACRKVYVALCERLRTATEEIDAELASGSDGKDKRTSRAQHRRHGT